MTKNQLRKQEAAALEERGAELFATYPQRLMDLLERASSNNFKISVKNGAFHVLDFDNFGDEPFVMTLVSTPENEEAMIGLNWRVEVKEEERREQERRDELRRNALAKLSKEEREALGL